MTLYDCASAVRLLKRASSVIENRGEPELDIVSGLRALSAQIAAHPIPWAVTLHLAYIDHRQGGDIHAAATREALIAQVAAFCRLWWSEINDPRDAEALDDESCVRAYFERHGDEYVTIDTIALSPAPRVDDGLERETVLVAGTVHISPGSADVLDEWGSLSQSDRPIGVADTGFGWFFPLVSLDEVTRAAVPDDVVALLDFAAGKQCRFLLLDRDGPEIDRMIRHEW